MENTIKQVAALSPGTEEKFKIIALLTKRGEIPFSDIQKEVKGINKSTLYNYLTDLVEGGLIKKRVLREEGKRPISFYSIKGFMVYLSPRCVLSMFNGSREKDVIAGAELIQTEDVEIIDDFGERMHFHPSILIKDMLDAGIRVEDALEVAAYVKENLYEGVTTEDIADMAEEKLREMDPELAEKFHWFLRGNIVVKTLKGTFEEWDRERLIDEINKLWKGIEKKKSEIVVLARHAERCIKRQGMHEPLEETYVRSVLRMTLRS